jgi:putative transposase
LEEPVSSVGRWVREVPALDVPPSPRRQREGPEETVLRERIRALCAGPRHLTFGYRRITALVRHQGQGVNRKRVYRCMREMGLTRPRVWHRPQRPRRVERMRPERPHQAWQVDMTSFQLTSLQGLFLVVIIDCFTRQIVGWTLDRRCRASEWVAAVRMALEERGLAGQSWEGSLVLRSDNGAQPCSKRFVEYLGKMGIRGQYTGYDAPNDNAYVERVIRTLKEEEIWPNAYETWAEAHAAIEAYIQYYNQQRIHSALDYRTPDEFAAMQLSPIAA